MHADLAFLVRLGRGTILTFLLGIVALGLTLLRGNRRREAPEGKRQRGRGSSNQSPAFRASVIARQFRAE